MRRAALALAVLIVVSCGGSVPAMRITRFSAVPANHYPAFDRSIDDVAAAPRMSEPVQALPAAPTARVSSGPAFDQAGAYFVASASRRR
ncbi:MAG TPA: hypothetical protein VI056_03375 [Candidatus Limnocylindria bacterium]